MRVIPNVILSNREEKECYGKMYHNVKERLERRGEPDASYIATLMMRHDEDIVEDNGNYFPRSEY